MHKKAISSLLGLVLWIGLGCSGEESGEADTAESDGQSTEDAEGRTTDGTPGDGGALDMEVPVNCSVGTDCIITHASCCGYTCGDSSLDEFMPARSDAYADLRAALCDGLDPEHCPNCPSFAQENFVSVCREGECRAVDVREDVLSRCDTAADCRLRWGGDCCEMCDVDEDEEFGEILIAVSHLLENWAVHVCEDVPGCPVCEFTYPEDASSDCVGGHCVVVRE